MAKKASKTRQVAAKLLMAGEYLNYLAGGTWLTVACIMLVFGNNGVFAPATTAVAHATLGFLCRWARQQ